MTQNLSSSSCSADARDLALLCLAHLEQEEAMLVGAVESLAQVRSALIRGDLPELTKALEAQAHTARAGEELRPGRDCMRQRIAGFLGSANDAITLEMLIERLSVPHSLSLARCRERLKGLAAQVDQLNRDNAALLRHSLDFLTRLLNQLTGGGRAGDRYTLSGKREGASCGSMIQARG
jgi:hypothetical protein